MQGNIISPSSEGPKAVDRLARVSGQVQIYIVLTNVLCGFLPKLCSPDAMCNASAQKDDGQRQGNGFGPHCGPRFVVLLANKVRLSVKSVVIVRSFMNASEALA